MPYQFATQDQYYSDYASGRVLYNQPGAPAFPIRLVSEIFQRAQAQIQSRRRLTIYDPTCGGAYHLTALGFLHGDVIEAILASDIEPRAVSLAQRNLGLLSPAGLNQREQEINALLAQYGKASHVEALKSIAVLRRQITQPPVRTRTFQANALDATSFLPALASETIDLVLCDIPYGQLSQWHSPEEVSNHPPLWQMLEALKQVIPPSAILAIAADKRQKIMHESYRRTAHFQVGKRQVTLLAVD